MAVMINANGLAERVPAALRLPTAVVADGADDSVWVSVVSLVRVLRLDLLLLESVESVDDADADALSLAEALAEADAVAIAVTEPVVATVAMVPVVPPVTAKRLE